MKEADLVREIANYLTLRKAWYWRQNVGTLVGASGRPVRFGQKGTPDFYARSRPRRGESPARVVWIEAKTEDGRQTKEQKEFERRAIAHGDVYILARCIEDVMEVL